MARLPDGTTDGLGTGQVQLILAEIKSISRGSIFGSPEPYKIAAAERFIGYQKTATALMLGVVAVQGFGIVAIIFAITMLFILIASLVSTGYQAFTQTHVQIEVFVDLEEIPEENLPRGGFREVLSISLGQYFPEVDLTSRNDAREVSSILSNGAQFQLRDMFVADPSLIGQTITLKVLTSDPYDQLNKGLLKRDTIELNRPLDDPKIARFDGLQDLGLVSKPLNTSLLTCFVISFSLGLSAAIYLEEFAPQNRMSDLIEVNINNLAAVPSVVFGLLALSVFIGWFGLPRSAPFVAGLALALMTLPTQIFIWADSPKRGFVSRTSAAILGLLAFLITMNAIAIYLRQKFERKWQVAPSWRTC